MPKPGRPDEATEPVPLGDPNALRDWCFANFIHADIARRKAAGDDVLPEENWTGVQVVFHPEGGHSVRLNEEITLTVAGYTAEEPGDGFKLDDITEFHGVRTAGADENCAHISFFRYRGKWACTANLAYNVPIAERHLDTASEFLDAAEDALEAGRLRVFVDTLHSGTELMAKALIYTHGEQESLARGRNRTKHAKVTQTFQRLGRAGRVNRAFPKLHAKVQNLRGSARYVAVEPLDLSESDARELLREARAMQTDLRRFVGEAFSPGE